MKFDIFDRLTLSGGPFEPPMKISALQKHAYAFEVTKKIIKLATYKPKGYECLGEGK